MSSTMNGPQHACGNCGQENSSEDQYCAGCGLFLWEKCQGCNALVFLGQPFCNKCGNNLKAEYEKRVAEAEARLERVKKLGEEGLFSDAIKILKPNLEPPDYRFQDLAAQARELYDQYTNARESWREQVPLIESQAKSAMDNADYALVCKLIQPIPAGTRTEECEALLEQAINNRGIAKQSKDSLKEALANKDWQVAIGDLVALTGLYPEKQKYRDLLVSVSERIAKQTEKLISQGLHAEALAELNSIPVEYQLEQHTKIRKSLDDLLLARKIVASESFATPFISDLVGFLRSTTEDDKKSKALESKLAKVKRSNPLHCYPTWIGTPKGLFQDPISPATLANSIPGANIAAIKKAGPQYWVAVGLALQGIGAGQDTANLHIVKKGLLSKLGRKKTVDLAWGMDIGDSQIKLVCVQRLENEIKVVRAEALPLGEDNFDVSNAAATARLKGFKKAASEIPAEEPVVANIPPDLVLSRFIEMPVNTPAKKIEEFVSQEAKANIPVRFEDLSMGYCLFDAHADEAMSRQALCFAPRTNDLESHADLLVKAGINLAGVIPEPIAYLNVLSTFEYFGEVSHELDAMICIDVGAKHTTFVACSPIGIWFRTISWGVDMISQAFAKARGITSREASKVRLKPLKGSLIDNFQILDTACIVPRRELERSLRAAKEQLGELQISQILLTGGGAYQPLLGSLLNGDLG